MITQKLRGSLLLPSNTEFVFFRSLSLFIFSFTQEKKVKKHYLALAAAPVPLGTITHYMRPINMAPRLISEGNSLCQALHRN